MERRARTSSLIGAWAAAGGGVGLAAGASARLVGGEGSALWPTALGAALLAVLGWAVLTRTARGLAERPAVADHRGRAHRPWPAWVTVVPAAVGVAAAVWLAAVAALWVGSLVPLLVAAGLVGAALWSGRVTWVRHRLAVGLQAEAEGRVEDARRVLSSLAVSRLAGPGMKATAALDLGLMAMRQDALARAERWLTIAARTSSTGGVASAALVVVCLRKGDHAAAERWLRQGLAGGAASRELDGARALFVLRTEGPAAALDLGERLLDPDAGSLLRGTVAAARRGLGLHPGAGLAEPELLRALDQAGLRAALPELEG